MNICDMNIFQKMASITIELQTVAKNLTVATSKNASYKAVSERDILDAVKPLENKYGVYSYPVSRTVLESNLLESESEYSGKVTKKTTFMTRIATVYRFVNTDNPDEYIETTTFAEGIDAQNIFRRTVHARRYPCGKCAVPFVPLRRYQSGGRLSGSAPHQCGYCRQRPPSRCKRSSARGDLHLPRRRADCNS